MEATRDGGAVIVRHDPGQLGLLDTAARRTVTLEPVTPAGTITAWRQANGHRQAETAVMVRALSPVY